MGVTPFFLRKMRNRYEGLTNTFLASTSAGKSSESAAAWMLALPSRKRMSSKDGWECFSKFQMRLCSSKRSENFSSVRSIEMDSRKASVGFADVVTPDEQEDGRPAGRGVSTN